MRVVLGKKIASSEQHQWRDSSRDSTRSLVGARKTRVIIAHLNRRPFFGKRDTTILNILMADKQMSGLSEVSRPTDHELADLNIQILDFE